MNTLARALAASAIAVTSVACSRGGPPTNLVLISIDTLVPGRMSAYGAERSTTPAIEKLAARGVRFTNAFSPSPWTLPAHASMLSGRYPSSLAPDGNDWSILYAELPLLAEVFRRAGHRTGAVTGGGYLSARFGTNRGFDTFDEVDHWRGGRPGGHRDEVQRAVRAAVSWLEKNHETPFFLFFHTYVAHAPYRDRRYTRGLEGGRLGELYARDKWVDQHLTICCERLALSDAEKTFLLALYDGGVAAADEMVAALVAALVRVDAIDDTVIVITSDHGEEFWEHTGAGAYHGHSLYNELLRVPLVWYEPRLPLPGRTVDAHVSLIDIVPTVVARFRLAAPVGMDGVDLSPLLDGGDLGMERALFAEAVRHGPERFSVQTPQGKLIETPDPAAQRGEGERWPVAVRAQRELYVSGDGAEESNRIDAAPDLVADLARRLRQHRAGATTIRPSGAPKAVDAEVEKQLRALGYLH